MTSAGIFSKPVIDAAQNRRAMVLGLIYAVIIGGTFLLAYEIRFDFLVAPEFQSERLWLLLPVIGIKLIMLIAARQLGSLLTYFSIPDFMRLLWAMLASSVVLLMLRLIGGSGLGSPRGVLLIDFMLCTGALCGGRIAVRIFRERLSGNRDKGNAAVQLQRIAIIGAGDAGASLAREFVTNPSRGFKPVAFFDDDVEKHGKLIHGVPVMGRAEEIRDARGLDSLAKVVIAMPTASARRIRQIVQLVTELSLKVETLPSMADLAAGRVRASRIRPVEVQDLLGRETVDLDSEGIRRSIQGHVVLVTGAGGSIGSELCRQIAALAPKRLLMVEQAEGALFLIEQELNELGLGSLAVPLVGDILDEERMRYIFSHYQPDVVFHAAAHKHVYMMERQPAEAIRNNVLGTRLLAEIAAEHHVESFVLISTDKAINPTNVMGATKRLAELQVLAVSAAQGAAERHAHGSRLAVRDSVAAGSHGVAVSEGGHAEARANAGAERATGHNGGHTSTDAARAILTTVAKHAGANPATGIPRRSTKFMVVRFGNVLGSSGSVIPIFKRQIAHGGPVTVTHPDVTRYFMTIPEAVGLVMQASILGKGGEIFVLDMGQPVKIVDLAKQMIELSGFKAGEDIEIKFTGLKPGEKLFEELQHKTEQYTATEHSRIMRFTTDAAFSEAGVQELRQRLYQLDSNALKQLLQRLVPEYRPCLD